MFSINDQQGNEGADYGDRFVERIMAAEYNLAVQRNDVNTAGNVLGRLIGYWLQRRANR